jgi:hypothetical protein
LTHFGSEARTAAVENKVDPPGDKALPSACRKTSHRAPPSALPKSAGRPLFLIASPASNPFVEVVDDQTRRGRYRQRACSLPALQ